MQLAIQVVLVVAVYGRDLSEAGYYPAQPFERYDRQRINSPPPGITDKRYEGNDPNRGNYETQRPVSLYNNGQVPNNEYNQDLLNDDRNGRRHNLPNMDNIHTHGVITDMDVNLAFDKQAPNTHRDGNLNLPKQSFSVNNEYAKRVAVTKNDNNRGQILPTRRSESDMVFKDDDEEHNGKRNTSIKPDAYNSNNNHVPEIGIGSFLNNIDINNTNQNVNSNKQIKTQYNESNNNQIGFKSESVSNKDQRPLKTTIENEVTPNPFRKEPIPSENKTLEEDKWIWDDGGEKGVVEATTEPTTLVTLDDRASFDGGKCATGMARVQGKCVSTD